MDVEAGTNRVYVYSPGVRLVSCLGFLGFLLGPFLPLIGAPNTGAFLACGSLALPAIIYLGWWCYESSSKITVDESGIAYQRLLGAEKRMRWEEIDHVTETFFGGRIDLHDLTGRVRIPIDYVIVGFAGLVARINRERPDLWSVGPGGVVFRVYPFLALIGVGGSLLIGVPAVRALLRGEDTVAAVCLIGLACVLLPLPLIQLRRVVLATDLELAYLFRSRRVRRDEISYVSMVDRIVLVHLTDGKKIRLGGLREGATSLYESLRHWLKAGEQPD